MKQNLLSLLNVVQSMVSTLPDHDVQQQLSEAELSIESCRRELALSNETLSRLSAENKQLKDMLSAYEAERISLSDQVKVLKDEASVHPDALNKLNQLVSAMTSMNAQITFDETNRLLVIDWYNTTYTFHTIDDAVVPPAEISKHEV